MKSHLEPFAYASNIAQSDKAQLDSVLMVLALLYHRFRSFPQHTTSDTIISETVCNSINSRWEASDQDLFIAAVILNPMHKLRPFQTTPWLSPAIISVLMSRLYTRFFKTPAPRELLQEVPDYLRNKGLYSQMAVYVSMYMQPDPDGVRYISYNHWSFSYLISCFYRHLPHLLIPSNFGHFSYRITDRPLL